MAAQKIQIGLADDHVLLRNGLAGMINGFDGYSVLLEADNGLQLAEQITAGTVPDLVLMDINMPVQDGFVSTRWLRDHYPQINVLALSMYDNEAAIIRMLRCGARGYLLKDTSPGEFRRALDAVMKNGFHLSEIVSGQLVKAVYGKDESGFSTARSNGSSINPRESEFLRLACTELTYKEIADRMNVSHRTVDGYRDALFEKLDIRTRVGLVLYAIKNNLVIIH